jgi:hypothetical protein
VLGNIDGRANNGTAMCHFYLWFYGLCKTHYNFTRAGGENQRLGSAQKVGFYFFRMSFKVYSSKKQETQ